MVHKLMSKEQMAMIQVSTQTGRMNLSPTHPNVELYVKVPKTLDMYEARLYLMNNAKSPSLNSFPLALGIGIVR